MNIIKRYADWCDTFTDTPYHFNYQIGYWIASMSLGRQIWMADGDGRLYPNMWLIILAPSSFYRKSTAISIGCRLLNEIKPSLILPSEWSQESLIKSIVEQPRCAMIAYEFKRFISIMGRDYNAGVQSMLTEMYDCYPYCRRTLKEGLVRIDEPFLNILGASTMEWLVDCVKSNDIVGGFMARFIVAIANKKTKTLPMQLPADMNKRSEIISQFKALSTFSGEIGYSDSAKKMYYDWYTDFSRNIENRGGIMAPMFHRLCQYVHKFAMIEAAMRNSCTIDIHDSKTAINMIEEYVISVDKLGSQSLGDTWEQRNRLRVLGLIKKNPGIGRSRLLKNSNLAAKQLKDILETLLTSESIRDGGVGEGGSSGGFWAKDDEVLAST